MHICIWIHINHHQAPAVAYVSTDGFDFTQVSWGDLTQLTYGNHYFDPAKVQLIALCVQRTNASGYGELSGLHL